MVANTFKKDNLSPRGYISFSQLSMWEKDPNLYYQIYVDGMDMIRTPYLNLGTRLDEAIQKGKDEFGDTMINYLVMMLPRYPKMQHRIEVDFEGVPLVGVLDGFNDSNKKKLICGEHKSGKNWTQSLADKSDQITIYNLMVWLKYGIIPFENHLHWAKTKVNDEDELFFTGDIKDFKTTREMKDLILMGGRIHKAYNEIKEMWKDFDPSLNKT